MGVLASPALADNGLLDRSKGYIEICKAPNPDLHGNFAFRVYQARDFESLQSVQGQVYIIPIDGTLTKCTEPISVEPHSVVWVEELGGSTIGMSKDDFASGGYWWTTDHLSATATAIGPDGPLAAPPTKPDPELTYFHKVRDFKWEVDNVPQNWDGSSQNVVTVTVSDTLVTGVIEVCKQIVGGTVLTGSYQFTITGANEFTTQVTVPIGQCSPAVTLPAGHFMVEETGDAAENVVDMSAVGPDGNQLIASWDAKLVAYTVPGDSSKQTLVTFVNDPVRLKICKELDGSLRDPKTHLYSGTYVFDFTYSPAGANAGPSQVKLPVDPYSGEACAMVGLPNYRAGTIVGITEEVVPGTKVDSIDVNPWKAGVDAKGKPTANETARTVTVTLQAGETVVTYTNEAADPGTLKICKVAGTGVAAGTVFTFTVAGVTTPFHVQAGQCLDVGKYPFNSTQTVVESAATGYAVTAIATNVPSRLVSSDKTARTAQVLIGGENDYTEVMFTNSVAAAGGGGGGGGGSSSSVVSAETSAPTVIASPSVTPIGVAIVSQSKATTKSAATLAKLAKLQKQLVTLKAKIKTLSHKRAAAKTVAAKKAFTKQILALQAQQRQLQLSIKALK